ncbi:MAG: VUT family protein, partial [Candidatus Marinimicrobia bacterium]|nr:VUT family protein [Candidatus Neomarinimicrobiota bacterium]
IASQLIDTTLVISILFVGVWDTNQILSAIIDGWIFKMLMALLDTPIIYAIIYFLKRKIDIAPYQ